MYERSIPRTIFSAVDTIPRPTPMRMARFAARFGTLSTQSADIPTGSVSGPKGKNRIITMTADTSKTDANTDRARKAR